MPSQDFHTSFSVPQSAEEVFTAVTDPKRWWTGEIEGTATEVGDEFTYRYGDFHFSKQKVVELIPRQKDRLAGAETNAGRRPEIPKNPNNLAIQQLRTLIRVIDFYSVACLADSADEQGEEKHRSLSVPRTPSVACDQYFDAWPRARRASGNGPLVSPPSVLSRPPAHPTHLPP